MDGQSMVVAGEPLRVTRNGQRYFSEAHRDAVVAKCLVPGRHSLQWHWRTA
jgi:hypothetical protein